MDYRWHFDWRKLKVKLRENGGKSLPKEMSTSVKVTGERGWGFVFFFVFFLLFGGVCQQSKLKIRQ